MKCGVEESKVVVHLERQTAHCVRGEGDWEGCPQRYPFIYIDSREAKKRYSWNLQSGH